MEPLQKLEALSNQYNLPLTLNDRLFYGKYLYRISIQMYRYHYPQLMHVPTIDNWGWKVDTEYRTSFTTTLRRFADKWGDRVRVEYQTLNYYTDNVDRIQKLVEYVNRLKRKEEDVTDLMLDLIAIRYFPGTATERNIRYRKKRLPHGKYRFQILGNRMNYEQYMDWANWAAQYPDTIRVNNNESIRRWGTWCGESIGYITDEKMLQLVQFKLGSQINKIIEFQLRETE
jgi:hypothetical protein